MLHAGLHGRCPNDLPFRLPAAVPVSIGHHPFRAPEIERPDDTDGFPPRGEWPNLVRPPSRRSRALGTPGAGIHSPVEVEGAAMNETIVVLDAIGRSVAERLRALLPEGFELTHGTAFGDDHLAEIISQAHVREHRPRLSRRGPSGPRRGGGSGAASRRNHLRPPVREMFDEATTNRSPTGVRFQSSGPGIGGPRPWKTLPAEPDGRGILLRNRGNGPASKGTSILRVETPGGGFDTSNPIDQGCSREPSPCESSLSRSRNDGRDARSAPPLGSSTRYHRGREAKMSGRTAICRPRAGVP